MLSMKKLLFASLLGILLSCAKTTKGPVTETILNDTTAGTKINTAVSRCIAVKLNYQTYALEGAREMTLSSSQTIGDTLPLRVEYVAPGTPGLAKVFFSPNNDNIFYGDILNGTGSGLLRVPQQFDAPGSFTLVPSPFPKPPASRFQRVNLGYSIDGTAVDLDKLWGSINRLLVLDTYLTAEKSLAYFIYTPGAGPPINVNTAKIMVYLFK